MLGDVAHPLQRRADPEGADHDAEVARDRLLAREDLDRLLVEGDGLLVDDRVGFDDFFGEGDITRAERAGRLLDRHGHQSGDLDESLLDVFERLVENFAHGNTSLIRGGNRPATLAIVVSEG